MQVGLVTNSNLQSIPLKEKSAFKTCCSKIIALVKNIFYYLCFCFVFSKKWRSKITIKRFRQIDNVVKKADSKVKTKEVPKDSLLTSAFDSTTTLADYRLPNVIDSDLINLKKFANEFLRSILLYSKFQTGYKVINEDGSTHTSGIFPKLESLAKAVEKNTCIDSLKATFGKKASLIEGAKKLLHEALNNKTKISSLFNLDSFMNVATKVAYLLVISLYYSLKNKENTCSDKKAIAIEVFNEIKKNINKESFRQEFDISNNELTFFVENISPIQDFITGLVEGMIPEGINTKELIDIAHDLLVIFNYFTSTSTQTPREKQEQKEKIMKMLQSFGQDFLKNFQDIEYNLINNNINMIVEHIVERLATMLPKKINDHGMNVDIHKQNVDELIKKLSITIKAISEAENEALGYIERKKIEIENKYKIDSNSSNREEMEKQKALELKDVEKEYEKVIILLFQEKNPWCHKRIKEILETTDKPLPLALEDLRKKIITEIAQHLCRNVLKSKIKVDKQGKEYEVPWLRVLWNSLNKPLSLINLLASANKIVDEILNIKEIENQLISTSIKPAIGFKFKFLNLFQRLLIYTLNHEIEQNIECYIVQKILELVENKNLLFKSIYDQLLITRVSILLKKHQEKLAFHFLSLLKASNEDEREKIRILIAEKLYDLFDNKDLFNVKKIVNIETFKDLIIPYFIRDRIEKYLKESVSIYSGEQDIVKFFKNYFEGSDQNCKNIDHLRKDVNQLIHNLVFELGNLNLFGAETAIYFKSTMIFNLCSYLIVPIRESPLYFLKLYQKSLIDHTVKENKFDNEKIFTYFTSSKDGIIDYTKNEAKDANITEDQYDNFAKLFHDVIVAPLEDTITGSTIKWYFSNKVIKLQMAVKNIFHGLYHPVVLNNTILQTYSLYTN